MPITFAPADTVDFSALAAIFNRGYEGYFTPVQLSEAQMRGHVQQNDIDLAASRLAYDGTEAVGVALLGRRGAAGWIGGIGVAASHRKQGIGRQLMLEVMEAARQNGIRDLQLEVITNNERAYNLYLSLGFTVTRRLLIVERQPAPMSSGGSLPVSVVTLDEALRHYDAFHTAENPWQRQLVSLQANPGYEARAARRERLAAYATGIFNERYIALTDLAAEAGDAEALRSLVMALHHEQPEAKGRLVNLAEDDPAWAVLSSLGYAETMAQWEMSLQL